MRKSVTAHRIKIGLIDKLLLYFVDKLDTVYIFIKPAIFVLTSGLNSVSH